MVFNDVVGQQNVIKSIKNALIHKRVAHAYLFCGPDGVGKSIAASLLASTLNCKKRGTDPCGLCPSCIKVHSGNHPDIMHVKIQGLSIHVDDIRKLLTDIKKKPYEDGTKVYIIHESDKMTEGAQNALLKTLEEPPGHAVIILLAKNQYSLLETIVSRCQVLRFRRASEREIGDFLKNKKGTLEKEARLFAALSGGIVGKALALMEDRAAREDIDRIIELTRELHKGDKLYVLSQTDYFINNKDRIDYILGIMMSWFRDILIYKECNDNRYLINLDKEDIIIDECKRFTYNSLDNILKCIKNTLDNVKSNANFQLSIENMLLSIQEG